MASANPPSSATKGQDPSHPIKRIRRIQVFLCLPRRNTWLPAQQIELMDPPLFESDSLAAEKEEEEDDETIACFLEEDLEEETAILPPNLSSRAGSTTGESPFPIQGDLDLFEMCRRVAAKLSMDWPSQQKGQGKERDSYDGKRLLSCTSPAKELIPAIPACITEMRWFWDKLFS